jgi:hypothetical protein
MAMTIEQIKNSCPVQFLGFQDHGRVLRIRHNSHGASIAEDFRQADLRDEAGQILAELVGEVWLRRAFPRYEQVSADGGLILVITGFNLNAAADWIVDQCFLAEFHVPPSQVAKPW